MIAFGPGFWSDYWRNEIAEMEAGLADCHRLRHNAPYFASGQKLKDQLTVIDRMIGDYQRWIAENHQKLAEHGHACAPGEPAL